MQHPSYLGVKDVAAGILQNERERQKQSNLRTKKYLFYSYDADSRKAIWVTIPPFSYSMMYTGDMLIALTVSWYCLLLQEHREKRDNQRKIHAYSEAIFSLGINVTAVFLEIDDG